jgi:hypothetical protein
VLGCVIASVGLGCTPRPAPTPASVMAPTATPNPAARSAAPGDLLRCPLALRAYELGIPEAGPPTAPFVSGDGVFVAFAEARADGSGYDLVAARLDRGGTLRPGARFERAAPGMTVLAAGYGEALRAPARIGERWMLVSFDASSGGGQADAPAPTLPGAPSDLVLGPRGLVALYDDATHRTVARELEHRAQPAVALPRPPSSTVPSEQLLASGADVDVLLLPTPNAVRFVVLRPGEAAPARDEVGFERGESSVAAGPSGFAVVHGDPSFTRLTLRRFDRAGAPVGEPTSIPAPEGTSVLRHPRVAALGEGWAVSYWDGVGPAVLRFDAAGRALGPPTPVRSGDERGGHTDARMVATREGLAVTWHVHEPEFSHGVEAERPRRPGPRLGLLRCR